ncbi:MAG: hypothetical protein ACI83W_002296 [Marinoscillum sp.]|jgi:hypothetical protein
MTRYLLIIVVLINFLDGCGSASMEMPNPMDTTNVADSIPLKDSTLLYPNCIQDDKNSFSGGCYNFESLDSDFGTPDWGAFDIFLYKNIFLDSVYITLHIDPDRILITNTCQEYILSEESGLRAFYEVTRSHPDSIYFHYCDDFLNILNAEPTRYRLNARIKLSSDLEIVHSESNGFHISAEMVDVNYNIDEDMVMSLDTVLFYQVWQHTL